MFKSMESIIAEHKRDLLRWSKELATIDIKQDPATADEILHWIIQHSKLIGSMESIVRTKI
jgi:hypothetical protein